MTESTSPGAPAAPDRLEIGVLVGPHGIRGELRMLIWTQFPERIPTLKRIYFNDEPEPRQLLGARVNGGVAVLRVAGVEDRDAAEALRGTVVKIPIDQAAPLAEDEYYHYQLIGLDVVDEAGNPIGKIAEILETGANDVYVIRDERGHETLLPALKSVILDIDLANRRVTARPLDYFEG